MDLFNKRKSGSISELMNRMMIYRREGHLDNAAEAGIKLDKYLRKEFGEQHTAVASNLSTLGEVFLDLGKYERAGECFEQAIAIWHATVGEAHPTLATGLARLADQRVAIGNTEAAVSLLERASAIILATELKEHHPEYSGIRQRLDGLRTAVVHSSEDSGQCPEGQMSAPSTVSDSIRWEKVYIFISSTFNDMHAERDILVKKVFPQLADWCEARRLRMIDIDLRWGVTEQDATRNQGVLQVCLQRIDECRPFFLCLLGQRYGWVPRKHEISADTFDRFPGLAEAVNEGKSVTELEILHAIIRPFSDQLLSTQSTHAIFYQRHPASLRDIPREPWQLWRTYTDAADFEPDTRKFLLARRRHLRKVTLADKGQSITVYRGTWISVARSPELEIPLRCPAILPENIERWRQQWREAGVYVEGLDVADIPGEEKKARQFNARLTNGRLGDFKVGSMSLAERILIDLQKSIEARFPGRLVKHPDSPLAIELAQQEQFQFSAAEGFVERTGDFTALDEYTRSKSDRPFVITAPGGAGKSMLLARWIDRERTVLSDSQIAKMHYRFIGASDQSTTVTNLINLLLRDLKETSGLIDQEIPAEPTRLRQVWPELLAQAGLYGLLIIVIDSLDQLHSGLTDLTWVPRRLPQNVKFIVSFRNDAPRGNEAIEHFRKGGAIMVEVPPFADLEDRRRLVCAYLAQYLKELDEHHLEALIGSPGASNPLFLKVVLSELRIFGAFGILAEKIEKDFGSTPESAFLAVLRRLEADPSYSMIDPTIAVPLIFGLLAHARRGLAGDEISALLCSALRHNPKDKAAWEAATDITYLIIRQVRPFLARRQGRFDFFYDTFRHAAMARYVTEGKTEAEGARPASNWHTLLSDYFHALPLWHEPIGSIRSPNERKVGELPYHLTLSSDGNRLGKLLTDLEFIEAKCTAGQTFDLVDDYARVPVSLNTVSIKQFADFVRNQAHVFARWPELVFQQAANTISSDVRTGQNAPYQAAAYRQLTGVESRPWIRRLNPAPTTGACLMTLAGHEGSVYAVGVSANGKYAISTGTDRTLRFWDLRTGNAMEIVRDLAKDMVRLVILPHTTLVAVTASNRRIMLWDFELLQQTGVLTGPECGVSCLAADVSGRYLVAGSSAVPSSSPKNPINSIVLHDLQKGTALDIGQYTAGVNVLALNRDARSIVCISNSTLHIFDPHKQAVTDTAHISGEYITSISFSPDEHTIAVGVWGGDIQILDSHSWQLVRTIHSQQGIVQDIAFRPDGAEIAGAGLDGTIIVWDLTTGESRTTLRGHTGPVTSIAYTPDEARLVTSSVDGTVRVWDPMFDRDYFKQARILLKQQFGAKSDEQDPVRAAMQFEGLLYAMSGSRKHSNQVTNVKITRSGRQAVSASLDDTVRVWNLESGTCEHVFEGHRHGVLSLTTSANGIRAATTDRAATIKVWDLHEGHEVASRAIAHVDSGIPSTNLTDQLFTDLQRPIIAPLRFAADDRLLLSADSLDPTIKVWDACTLDPLFTLVGHRKRVRSLIMMADGRHLVSASEEGVVILWDLANRTLLARGGCETGGNISEQLGEIGLTGDGCIACAWPDETVRLLDPDSLVEIGILRGHTGRIASVSTSGDMVAVARTFSRSTIIDVWQGSQREVVFSHQYRSEHVRVMCINAGRWLAIGGPGETLTIHDLGIGAAVMRFPSEVSCFDLAGKHGVAGNLVGEVFLLELND
jgi:WD40 repeat protein